jgi:hypothetical protein
MPTKKPVIGPATKRDAKKIAKVAKKEDKKILTPLTKSGNEAMQSKLKQNRKKALGVVGATIGTMGAGLYSMYLDKTKPGRRDRKIAKSRGK